MYKRQEYGKGQIIAEDLGYLTPAVRKLLRASGYPGMKILQFAFDSREESDYLPHRYGRNCVVYTGTHDNDTVQGWMRSAPRADVRFACEYLHVTDRRQAHWAFARAALSSVADLAVVPMQDYLGLGGEARVNTPSILGGNWCWRMAQEMCIRDSHHPGNQGIPAGRYPAAQLAHLGAGGFFH